MSVKRPDDYIDLAERGLFVYDWTDINLTTREALPAYEPSNPITASQLPCAITALAKPARLADVVLTEGDAVDIRALLSCAEVELSCIQSVKAL